MATLFTLPPHLRESIAALVDADVAPAALQTQLKAALAAAEEAVEEEAEDRASEGGAVEDEATTSDGADKPPLDGNTQADDAAQGDAEPKTLRPPRYRPPLIDGDVLERLARWAGTEKGQDGISAAGLDTADYGHIALLAGTEVYLPPKQRRLMAEAEKAAYEDKPNPYLPSYMSPTQPSLGTEARALGRQLSTILNVLFSIFGVGGGVFVAATTGAGWRRESAILLGILAGCIVGVADAGLIWIFKTRIRKERKEAAHRRVKMNKGSAAEPEVELLADSPDADSTPVTTIAEKPQIRLRRRAIK